jgi:peptidyl-prolyl cis-trans isomerase D
MFDAVRNNPKIVQLFLAVLTLALGSWGIDYFRTSASQEVVARVGSTEITSQQFDYALRQRQDATREQMNGSVDQSVLDSPEFKNQVLNGLINDEALKATARQSRIMVPDAALRGFIQSNPQFQDNGVFSKRLYEAVVANSGKSLPEFEAEQRNALVLYELFGPLKETALAPRVSAQRWIALDEEERTISELTFDGKSYLGDVKVPAGAAKKYYDDNKLAFQTPEQVKLEYVVLSTADLAKSVQVTDEQAHKWYDENIKNTVVPEERRASHILIQVAKSAKPEEREAAKKKAEDLLAKIKKDPSKFAELAKANSDDKASAVKGGDLDYFKASDMDPAFAKAVFALKPKEISGIVESSYGFHIIMLTDIRGGKTKTFDEAKDSAYEGVRNEAANRRFSELANEFASTVYEQRDSLKPAADKYGLKLVQTDWLPRDAMPAGVLQNQKFQQAIFSSDALNNHRNIEAVDLGDGTMASARVIEYKAATVKPFEQVATEAEAFVRAEESVKIAKAKGEEAIAKLKGGSQLAGVSWKAARAVTRSDSTLDSTARKQIFTAKTDKLPVYVGVAQNQSYVIYRIDAVSQGKTTEDAAKIKDLQQRYAGVLGEEDQRAFIYGIRNRLGVKIPHPPTK